MILLFDIGGTRTRLAPADFSAVRIFETPSNYDEGLTALVEVGLALAADQSIEAVGGGIAGPLDASRSLLINSPNLSKWIGQPLQRDLARGLGLSPDRVFLENDAALAALGEAHYGAGRDHRIFAYLTISTGVGGARIVDGRIDEKAVGFEPGHQIIDAGKALCPDCRSIYLGDYVSGQAVAQRVGRKPKEIKDSAFWDQAARFLAIGLNNTIVHWSPHAVALGGGMMGEPGIKLEAVENHLRELLKIFPQAPVLKKAELADRSGLYGALVLVDQKLGRRD